MYTEGFEDLEEFDKNPRRAYVSNVSPDDTDRIMRENERLKKALEKEQFFNKLLDQEIQELKDGSAARPAPPSEYWYGNRGVSKGAFYTLLFVALAMAAYIGYGIYYDKQFNYLKELKPMGSTAADKTDNDAVMPPPANDAVTGTPENTVAEEEQTPAEENKSTQIAPSNVSSNEDASKNTVDPSPVRNTAARDSVPNIIARQATPPRQTPPATTEQRSTAATPPPAAEEKDVETVKTPASGPIDTRPVIARYRVTSKANFYNEPNENSLRNTFISQGNDKVVGALEEKNGFIYVVYINDLGYTSRGWLSVKDLSKIE